MTNVGEAGAPDPGPPFAARGMRVHAGIEDSSGAGYDVGYRTIVEHVESGRRAEALTYLDGSLSDEDRRRRLLRNLVTLAGQLDPEGPWSALSI